MVKLAHDHFGAAEALPMSPGIPSISSRVLAKVIDTLPDPMYILDRSHRWVNVNAAFCEYMGRRCSELLGRTASDFLPAPEARALWESDESVFQSGDVLVNEAVVIGGARETRVMQTRKSLLHDADGNYLLVGMVRDLTGTDEARRLLHGDSVNEGIALGKRGGKPRQFGVQQVRFAFSDPLTQLPNRRTTMNLVDAKLADPKRSSALLIVDIDHFKLFNDRLGHSGGDAVLLEVANRMRGTIRAGDTLGRLDNDEFIVFVEDVNGMEAELLAEQLRREMEPPLVLGDDEFCLSVTLGIALFPGHGRSAQELVRNASLAMRQCKHRRRGGAEFYTEGASALADRQATIEMKLPLALEQDLLEVHYQPIVKGANGKLAGFEALLRWSEPVLGEIAPAEFIPIAEGMGIIRRLGHSIIDQACGFAASLRDGRLTVSANVSSAQLLDETFPIFVAESLQKHNINGDQLILEITESTAMESGSAIAQVFDELSAIGVRLIIDDFGTGFSNLARLKQLPFSGIKIDREFIRDLPASPADAAIFRATHAIARALDLSIVAEGVENDEQEAYLREFAVDFMQGYRFGRPQTAESLKRYRR